MRNGRPLRFLALVASGWISLRVAMLWPEIDSPAALIRALAPPAVAEGRARPRVAGFESLTPLVAQVPRQQYSTANLPSKPATAASTLLQAAWPEFGTDTVRWRVEDTPRLPPPIPPMPFPQGPSRLSGSAWLIVRGAGPARALPGSQLGGSQAGARIAYALGSARRIAAVARVSTPLEDRGREAALGLEWRVSNAVHVIAEQRIALERGVRGGPALGIVAGLNPTEVAAGFRLEAYGQTGIIFRDGTERYADGAARLAHPLASIGGKKIDFGIGIWGGAQRGAARLDTGPSLGLSLPVGQRRLRVTLDWRQRIAGSARPPSGPALSLGTDF